jgi:hypothetical protein
MPLSQQRLQIVDKAKRFDCPTCGRLLFVGDLKAGSVIEVKCHNRKCGNRQQGNLVTVVAAS